MSGPIPPKGTPERSAYFRDLVAKRWDKPRPETAPKDLRGARALPAGSEEESYWDARARDLGLSDEGMSRTAWRRMLKRLVDADVARRAAQGSAMTTGGPQSDDLLATYLVAEANRLRDRARRDRRLADAHDQEAAEAEARLAAHMRRQGMTS